MEVPDRNWYVTILCQELPGMSKCVLSVVLNTDSSIVEIPYRIDGNGYGTVPLCTKGYAALMVL